MATTKKKATRAYASYVALPKAVTRVPKDGDVIMTPAGKRAVRGSDLVYPKRGEVAPEGAGAAPTKRTSVIGRCQNGWAPAGARTEAERAHAQAKRDERKAKKANAQADTQALADEVKALKKALADVLKALA